MPCQNRIRQRARALAAAMLAVGVAGCGRPEAPNIRDEMGRAIVALGVRPVFPLSETLRIGSVHLVDTAAAQVGSGVPAHQETSVLITEDLLPVFERARRERATMRDGGRFPQSAGGLTTALRGSAAAGMYRQKQAESGDAPAAGALALAAFPGLTLASVDQLTLATYLPQPLATFFAALGLRNTSFMRIEPEAVEVADLPIGDVIRLLRDACNNGPAANPDHRRAVGYAYDILSAIASQRVGADGKPAEIRPRLFMARRVYYMRGIKFTIEDSRVVTGMVQAAIANPLADGATPPTLPGITINNNLQPTVPSGRPADTTADLAARVKAVQDQLDQVRAALATGANIQFGASAARATATGIELVQLFDRPLAFGYQAVQRVPQIYPHAQGASSDGLASLCAVPRNPD